ncbi:MAG TPA: tetratricopeptide repeat protein [Polyangia bacterium]|nr:tetratricopeptide repeat protein [Polyangia bacterium]
MRVGGGDRLSKLGRVACVFLLCLACGCAGMLAGGRRLDPTSDTGRAWQALIDGKDDEAAAIFGRVLEAGANGESRSLALFGAGSLAYERGDDEAAARFYLDVIGAAAESGDARDGLLSEAAAVRLPRLLDELPDRRAAEARVLAQPRDRLPWRAQYLLASLSIEIARRRADMDLLESEARRSGCLAELHLLGVAGRLPYLDLSSNDVRPAHPARTLARSGCQFTTPSTDALPGVRTLQSEVDVRAGHYDIVLDYAGPALLRVDGGAWHHHADSPEAFGTRWSALSLALSEGQHRVELRLGSRGGGIDVGLLLARASGRKPVDRESWPDRSGLEEAVFELAAALSAHMAGEVDQELAHTAALAQRSRFALGLSAAARMFEMDPTRPENVNRDRARGLHLRAVAVDPRLARVWLDLAHMEMDNDRPREAAEDAQRARSAAADWWPAALQLADASRARGLERDADAALADAVAHGQTGQGACAVSEAGLRRAEERAMVGEQERLAKLLLRCDAQAEAPVHWHRQRGDASAAEAALKRMGSTSADPTWVRSELAELLLQRGDAAGAASELQALVDWSSRDSQTRLRLVDALLAAGAAAKARAVLAETLRLFPGSSTVRQAARIAGLPLPFDEFRLDGGQVIRDFLASGHRYQAPAVVVLDRAVERIFPDGGRASLTHTITQVLSKEGIERAAEVSVPSGAEVLALRTRKTDGTIREVQEIAGKPTVSATDVAVGDFVEWETLEYKQPAEAFAPGFLGERFYFQSFEAPLDRSEYLLVVPSEMSVDQDRRAGAPEPTLGPGPDGTRVWRFVARQMPQLFPERSSFVAEAWIPSVRVSSGVDLARWSRFLADRLYTVARISPEVRRVAAQIRAEAVAARATIPEAITRWVNQHIEPEASLFEPATVSLGRGQGNRAAVVVALARALGQKADFMLLRPLTRAAAAAPATPQELDDFSEALVRLTDPAGAAQFFDPRTRRAPLGYLPPALAGAPGFVVGDDVLAIAHGAVPDGRRVIMKMRLAPDGSAAASLTEALSGWPSLEWGEIVERTGQDRSKLRQEFEQRWLSQQFPGSVLGELSVGEGPAGGKVVSYTLTSPRMATRTGNILGLRPGFFLSQPGRRYFTESQRRTPLQLGYDVPFLLEADIELPAGAQVTDLGASGSITAGGARFSEERQVQVDGPRGDVAGAAHLLMRRRWQLPLARVLPADYDEMARHLRQVDPLEQGEIRVELPPGPGK